MKQRGDDWKANAAATLKLLKQYYESLFEATAVAFAVKNVLLESDPTFQRRFEKHYAALIEGEFGHSKHVMLHLLDKSIGKLLDDPLWRD